MRGFKIDSAKALVWVGVLLAAWCGSAALASAQSYNFSFSSGSDSVIGSFLVSGTTVTQIQGEVTWPDNLNGAGSFLSTNVNGSFQNTSGYLIFFATPVSGGDNDAIQIQVPPGQGTDQDFSNGNYFTGNNLEPNSTPTPAPVPGSGPLSYLAVGLGGLFFYRKRLWRAARMTVGMAV
jgi:hypothetical protein